MEHSICKNCGREYTENPLYSEKINSAFCSAYCKIAYYEKKYAKEVYEE